MINDRIKNDAKITAHAGGQKGVSTAYHLMILNSMIKQTKTINIRDRIRQGGVLSVIEYTNLMNDISKELLDNSIGTQLWSTNFPGSLLWVDDVAVIHNNKNDRKIC